MSFQQPLFLLTLLAVPLVLAAVVWWRRRRPARGIAYPDLDLIVAADPGPRLRRHVPLALALLALTGLAFGLARPEVYRAQPRERATIMLAIDVSGSMAADDVSPYRLRAAQDAARTFADQVPRQYQVGLVSFNGRANLLVAPTTDRDALKNAIESLVPDGATAVGEAIAASLDAIRTSQGVAQDGAKLEAARIVVLSDGATTVGLPPSVAAEQA
ncbi:MAG TPA: VWA domain-containing protein, partial [Miltoncostaeaceae bacterium]|nr:VWA domain-containing protein [Miltoncostaeaceae bacterium]